MSKKNVKPTDSGNSAEQADLLPELERRIVASLEAAAAAVRELSAARRDAKLSVSRLVAVTRELNELIKVVSVYGC